MAMLVLPRDTNQVRGLTQYARDVIGGRLDPIEPEVLRRVELFHLDSLACAVAALATGTNAPRVLGQEARQYPPPGDARGAWVLGAGCRAAAEKAVAANGAAVRELDANGTNFGYNPQTGQTQGEFGHNDFYPVAVAGAQEAGASGPKLLRAMLCLDEIRGRLAEAFALRRYKIDHVLHGGIASAIVYGVLRGASDAQIESAVGLLVAHYVPFRAIRAGHQLSDSKGASAALNAELAVLSVHRALRGFRGPADIFRNPQAVFCLFEPPEQSGCSPFDLHLGTEGQEFAVMGMHFKLGMYEHQSAGAIQGIIHLLQQYPELMQAPEKIQTIRITLYEPAFSIIGDPAKRDPRNRQSADHSMIYIVATVLRKALQIRRSDWQSLMLLPEDYARDALFHPLTRQLMQRIQLQHGGPEYDRLYPEGIPTSVQVVHEQLGEVDSGLVMYPLGHARGPRAEMEPVLQHKIARFAAYGGLSTDQLRRHAVDLDQLTPEQVQELYCLPITPQAGAPVLEDL